jgi:hypothetical protein
MCWHPQAQQNMAEEKKIPLSIVDLLDQEPNLITQNKLHKKLAGVA